MITDHITVRERITLDVATSQVRKTADGYLVASPRVARTGIQIYAGREVGKPNMDRVRVWRPESEVFDKAALSTAAHRPITNDHPTEAVDASNWRKFSVGQTGGDVARDGEFIRVPMVVMDGAAVKDIEEGKRELSLGYTANLEWRAGTTPDNQAYDAVQTNIRINHLAIVDAARGGNKLAIGDAPTPGFTLARAELLVKEGKVEATKALDASGGEIEHLLSNADYPVVKDGIIYRDAINVAIHRATKKNDREAMCIASELLKLFNVERTTQMDKTILIDGVPVKTDDVGATVISRQLAKLEADVKSANDAKAKAEQALADAKIVSDKAASDAKVALDAKTAETATLQTQLKDATEQLSPANLEKHVKDRDLVKAKAKAVIGDKFTDADAALDTAEIRKKVVMTKLGDVAKAYTADQFVVAFDTLTSGIDVTKLGAADQMRNAFSVPLVHGDAKETAHAAYDKRISESWRKTATA